ncbi:malonate decarboxylase subunit epsilon [Massilia sp. Root133]|uniref:[acyl-carrier-protein] S-malonyltransferase n=1 Tax=Massilia cellulosiltytica TaxID=2683234 RepID=A0A7X3G4W4_9BURK|nr:MULTISPECIES: malonate decarboxylase subunit epsilon [Telluria group]KQY00951.1 malonate decarboxylase subunit epsilon [Massilia sp. Root133]KQZ53020.1 malonate decarboxylase subunit epsilon [Massilia sp. Root1485]MVW63720.1 malonate decarboxylase subunit epsilon [Telluria cellulosilytica]
MTVLFTFPGQGAQKPGMLHALPAHPATERTLAEATQALGRDVLALDAAEALRSTVAVQLSLLVAGVAMARVLAAHCAVPRMVAGLSIGAWPAAVVAGVLDFSDAVRLVELRARLMEDAYPHDYGMTAIGGLTRQQLEPLLAQVHGPAYLANLNAPRQLVVSGSAPALDAVAALALAHGATRAERLAVPVPSHSPLLDDQARTLACACDQVPRKRPRITYVSSSAARALFDADRIMADLAANMARPVLWADTLRHAWERGARTALEMPSGSVLTRLALEADFGAGIALCADGNRLDTLVQVARADQ